MSFSPYLQRSTVSLNQPLSLVSWSCGDGSLEDFPSERLSSLLELSMNRKKASTRADAPQSLQALQSGINCLSLDQAFEAVRLAKLKLDDLREVQASAVASLALANQDVEEERRRSSIFVILLSLYFIVRSIALLRLR